MQPYTTNGHPSINASARRTADIPPTASSPRRGLAKSFRLSSSCFKEPLSGITSTAPSDFNQVVVFSKLPTSRITAIARSLSSAQSWTTI
eukprot:scaffold50_cov420-Prasinococcus_capsulatus_cf.AAC.13